MWQICSPLFFLVSGPRTLESSGASRPPAAGFELRPVSLRAALPRGQSGVRPQPAPLVTPGISPRAVVPVGHGDAPRFRAPRDRGRTLGPHWSFVQRHHWSHVHVLSRVSGKPFLRSASATNPLATTNDDSLTHSSNGHYVSIKWMWSVLKHEQ